MLFLADEKVKYVRNNKLSNTRSDVPDEDTDLLVVPDEDSPFTSIAEAAKRRTDLDKASSNVLSESSSNIDGQFKAYSDGTTSNEQWTGTAKGGPANEKVDGEKAIEGTHMEAVSVPRELAGERMPEEEKQDEKTIIEKTTEEQPTNGLARNGFDSTVGENYATDVSEHLSELLKNESTKLDVTGEQKNVEVPSMEASNINQPKEQLLMKPSGQSAMTSPNISKQTEEQPSENSAASPQVLETNVNPFDTLFGQDDSLQSSDQASGPVMDQPKASNSEQEQSSPMQPPVSLDQLSTSKDAQSMHNPSVSGTAAGEATIGNAAQANGPFDFGSEPSVQILDEQQVRVNNNPESGQEAPVSATPKLHPTPQSPTPQSQTPQFPTPQTPSAPQPPSPTQLSSSTSPPPPPPPPLPIATQKPPVDIDDLFGKHIVEKTDETQDDGMSGNKNSTIMLVQTGNDTQHNFLTFSKTNAALSSLNYITPENFFVGNELQNNQGLGAPDAPQATYMDERNAGIQISEQPASVRHFTSIKPIQNSDEYSLKQTKQQAILRENSDASNANETGIDASALNLQNRIIGNTSEPPIERESSAFVSTVSSSEAASNRVDNQQSSLKNESSSTEESDSATLQPPKSSLYKMEYTKVAYSASALLSSLKPDTVNSSDTNVLDRETNQINNYQSLAGSTATEGLQEHNETDSSISPSSSSNDTLTSTAEDSTYSEKSMQLQAGNEYKLWKSETKGENIPSSLNSLNATESNNNTIYSIQNRKNDEASLYTGNFERGPSSNPLQVFNASFGSTSENSIPAMSNYSSISLHGNNGTLDVYNYSSTTLQDMYNSSYIDYTRPNYTSSGNSTQHDLLGSNCSSLSCNKSSSIAEAPLSNYVQPHFYNFSTISKEQMQVIQNAAVSKASSFSSNVSVDVPSYIYQTKAVATNNKNIEVMSNNDTSYAVVSKPVLYNNTHALSNIGSANDSSYSYNSGLLSPSQNNARPKFYDYNNITLNQMKEIQDAAVSTEASPDRNVSAMNETSFFTSFPYVVNTTKIPLNSSKVPNANLWQYLSQDRGINASLAYSALASKGRPQASNFTTTPAQQMNSLPVAAASVQSGKDNETYGTKGTSDVVQNYHLVANMTSEVSATLSQPYEVVPNISALHSQPFRDVQSLYNESSIYQEYRISNSSSLNDNLSAILLPHKHAFTNNQSNQSWNSYMHNMSRMATGNNGSVSNYGQLYEIAYNYSQPFNSSKSSYLEQNVAVQAAVANDTYLATPASSLSIYNYTQPLNHSVPSNGQSGMGNNYWNSNSTYSKIFATKSNYSQQSNATTQEIYPPIAYESEVLKVPNNSSSILINSTNLLYAAQTAWKSENADSTNTSSKISSKAGNHYSSSLAGLFPTPSAAAESVGTVMPIVNYTIEKVAETNGEQQAKNYTPGTNKNAYAQPLNGAQAKVIGSLVVGHFRQQDIKIAVEQLIVQKPVGTVTTTAPLSQSPILSAIDQLGNGTSDRVEFGQKYTSSGGSQLSSPYRQSNLASPSIPTLSASISYSKVKNGAKKNESDDTFSQDKLPFRNEEPIITSQLVNPADSSKTKAALKKPSLTAIISGGKKRPNSDCK